MLSHDQQYIVDVGAQLSLRCEFYKSHFNLFDNPVQWKKSQYGEVSEINILGNVKEPFESTGRFQVTYDPSPPRYIMGLTIKSEYFVEHPSLTFPLKSSSRNIGLLSKSIRSDTMFYRSAQFKRIQEYLVDGNLAFM